MGIGEKWYGSQGGGRAAWGKEIDTSHNALLHLNFPSTLIFVYFNVSSIPLVLLLNLRMTYLAPLSWCMSTLVWLFLMQEPLGLNLQFEQ